MRTQNTEKEKKCASKGNARIAQESLNKVVYYRMWVNSGTFLYASQWLHLIPKYHSRFVHSVALSRLRGLVNNDGENFKEHERPHLSCKGTGLA